VTNNFCRRAPAADTCAAVATNILVTQVDGVEVSDNRAGISQIEIFRSREPRAGDGERDFCEQRLRRDSYRGRWEPVRHNRVFTARNPAFLSAGNNNVVEHNKITEAAVGHSQTECLSANVIRFNEVFDTLVAVQDPARRVWRVSFRQSVETISCGDTADLHGRHGAGIEAFLLEEG